MYETAGRTRVTTKEDSIQYMHLFTFLTEIYDGMNQTYILNFHIKGVSSHYLNICINYDQS